MAETGDLIIKIGGDASKFKATIADVENSLKSFKANLGTTGLNIKIEALGFQETKSNIKSVADFAEGTLGAIKNTIKDVKAERLTISADPNSLAPFNIKLNELNTTVKELEKAGILKNVPQEAAVATNSLQGLTNKLNELRKQRAIIDPDTNARAILQINQQIDKLQQKIVNLNNLGQKIDTGGGLAGGFNGIKKGSAEAGRALTSLSLVAQDLPFGFIGIQNNLPAVIQTFGQLKTAAPAAGGALKALGSALVGPAGLFLAFSAVTAAVTFAIQKYGSLGAAYDALVGKIDPLAKIISTVNDDLENFNKGFLTTDQAIGKATASTEAQIIKVRQLSKAVLDTTKSENTRKFALEQLKSIDEARFGRYDVEKGKLAGLEGAVISYTRSIIANSVAQKLSDRAGDALIARNSALSLFTAQEKIVNDLIQKYPDLQRQAKKYQDDLIRTQGQLGQRPIAAPGVLDFLAASDQLKEYKKQLQDINAVYRQTRTEAIAATEESINLGEALTEATKDKKGGGGTGTKSVFAPQIDSQALDEAFNIDKIIANLTKYGNVLIDVNKTEAERKNALRELSEINPEYFNAFIIGKSSVADAKTQLEGFIRTLLVQKKAQEDALAAAKLNNEFRKNEEKGITAVGDKYRIFKDEISTLPETIEDVEKSFRNATLNADKLFKLDFSKFDTSFDFDQLSKGFKIIEEQTKQIRDNILSTLSGVQGILQDTFFKLLDEGKGNWKEFGDAVIKEIKRITAALLTKALIEGLANLISGGTIGAASAVAKGLKSIDTASLGEFLEITPGAANFGGIRGNQGVNMNGQVVMTLRGTDLVGAMNRTNTSINRVG
jgi:hypothetical protein